MVGVIQVRVTNNVTMGDGGIPTLATRIRGHANFIETAPYFLILLAVSELTAEIPPYWLNILFASCFTFGRAVHAIGFFFAEPSTPARIVGTFGALVPISTLSLYGMLGWTSSSHTMVISFQLFGAFIRVVVIPRLKPLPVKDGNKEQ